jgi:hypothetical protein
VCVSVCVRVYVGVVFVSMCVCVCVCVCFAADNTLEIESLFLCLPVQVRQHSHL